MKKISILFMLSLLMTSCLNDFLQIEPVSSVSSGTFWKTQKDARAGLNAIYTPIRNAYKTGYLTWFEARSDNFLGNMGGYNPMQDVSLNRLNMSMAGCNWFYWYQAIEYANYALYFIPQIKENITPVARNHYMSEAYFLRAYCNFNLYKIWGDVPLILTPVLKQTDVTLPKREDKTKVMQSILADIDSAMQKVDISQTELYLYSPGALYALATDIAMWNHDYTKALDCSKKLYDLNKYALDGVDFSQICALATTKDNIWTMPWVNTIDGDNGIIFGFMNSGNTLIPTKEILEKWRDLEPRDIRRYVTLDTIKITSYNSTHVVNIPSGSQMWKWSPGVHLPQAQYANAYIPIYRFADIILLRAEALNKTGDYDGAIAEMNKVRKRAGLADKSLFDYINLSNGLIDQDSLENSILQERQFELFGEGKRWFDLMRTRKVETVMNTYYDGYIKTYGGTSYRLYENEWQHYWPISQDILNENKNLTQTGNY